MSDLTCKVGHRAERVNSYADEFPASILSELFIWFETVLQLYGPSMTSVQGVYKATSRI